LIKNNRTTKSLNPGESIEKSRKQGMRDKEKNNFLTNRREFGTAFAKYNTEKKIS
jgi:hypothetical protein